MCENNSFSVIIPVYCTEKYIARCLDSILVQKNIEFEIILIDDGSTDGSGIICDQYAEKYKNIKVVHQKNQGVSYARNQGINLAEKKYLIFIDSDDYIKDGYFQALSSNLSDNEDICFGINHIEVYGKKQTVVSNGGDTACVKMRGGKKIREYFSTHNTEIPEAVCCNCYRTEFIRQNRILFSADYCIGEDVDFMFQAFFKMKKASWLEKAYYYYCHRMDGSATCSWNVDKIISIVSVYHKWYRILGANENRKSKYGGYLVRMADKANTNLLKGYQLSNKEGRLLNKKILYWKDFLLTSNSILKKTACYAYLFFGYQRVIGIIKWVSKTKNNYKMKRIGNGRI